ncbi:MAG TPA: EAL domain-containing protein [Polyangiaceae bacterium]|jgi:EAL domain-containing protein (putative c-di-GMP-specific phosphodiesterase class I)|nr:EAL domain-containing protein [Polyangiaceae bacterium]
MAEDRLNWTFNGDPGQAGIDGAIRSITAEDIDMVFQPIVEMETGTLFAHEALVRCKLPQFASPLILFAAAEREHACGHLGRVIRQQTFERCEDAALFVNVHPEELSQRWLVRPDDPLYFHEREVYLEITESAAFTHYDLCMSVLKEVCARARVHLVVDDYGAGHSNLGRILDLNPEIVKLDGALIRGIAKDRRRQLMVRHMVALCVDLGAKVVAECVETVEELKAVADLGVHYAQGYVLARPAFPAPDFDFPLARRAPVPVSSRLRPPPKPAAKGPAVDATAIPSGSTPKAVAVRPPSKRPSKQPSKRPPPPSSPKRPPP